MKYNPDKHHRKSIRLKNYNYSNIGAYFITLCAYNRESLFGDVQTGKIILSQFGQIIYNKWNQIPKHFQNVQLDEFIIMPNHLHGIIIIVGAKHSTKDSSKNLHHKQKNASPLRPNGTKPGSLSAPFWQRNYYDHVIRNDKELNEIREYIINNPLKWELDKENPKNWGANL